MNISPGTIARAAGATAIVAGAAYAASHLVRSEDPAAVDPERDFIRVEGDQLVLDGKIFRPFGFNDTFGSEMGTIDYTHDPSPAGLDKVRTHFENAKEMGANTLRVFFELHDFVERDEQTGKVTIKQESLDAYRDVLDEAERIGIKLDVTGNLVWTKNSAPEWYDAMPHRERWQVQAKFWKALARTGADSPAIAFYELTSEPSITSKPDARWYGGELGDHTFVQNVARGVEQAQLGEEMVQWTRTLRDAIKSEDPHHLVTIGMLPRTSGPLGPQLLAPELDLLTVHDYPTYIEDDPDWMYKHIDVARLYASFGKPVVLGETFSLSAGPGGLAPYLRATEPYYAGTFNFFDGRALDDLPEPTTMGEAIFRANLREYVGMREELTTGHGEPAETSTSASD